MPSLTPHRLFTLLLIGLLAACGDSASTTTTAPADQAVATLYNQSCISCHSSGVSGAPRAHDLTAWQPRLAQGMEVLLQHTREGTGAMPPMGMCNYCSDEDFKALIGYMSSAR